MRALYTPEPVPVDANQLQEYLERELRRISASIEQVHDHEGLYAEPSKKYVGIVRYADGVNWNPGSGEGMYYYDGTRWVFMGSSEYYLDVAKGLIPGHSLVHKFGHASVGTTIQAITETGMYMTPTTAQALEFVSSSANDAVGGTGATKITYTGIDSNWDQVTGEISTNGTTPVALPDSLFRLYRWYVSESGTYAGVGTVSYAGNLTIRAAGGGTAWSTISAAASYPAQSTIGVYTIPRNKKGYLLAKRIFADTNKSVNVYMQSRTNADDVTTPYSGTRRLIEEEIGVSGDIIIGYDAPKGPYQGPCDIGFVGNVSVGTADVAVEFDLLLVDD